MIKQILILLSIRQVTVAGSDSRDAYVLGPMPMNWMDAKHHCQKEGMVLATIHSNAEQTAAWETCKPHSCWLGLTDHITEGDWKWLDNKPYDPMATYWRIMEPNNYGGDENCAIMWGQDMLNNSKDGPWNDVNCDIGGKGTMIEVLPLCRDTGVCVPDCISPNQCNGASDGCGGTCMNECPTYSRGPALKWGAAKHWCEMLGTKLATIETLEQQGEAMEACGGVNCWIGATDMYVEGHWIWINDEKYIDPEEAYWAPGEPNNWNGAEDCACLYNDGLGILPVMKPGYWADANCGTPMYALCENTQLERPLDDYVIRATLLKGTLLKDINVDSTNEIGDEDK